MELKTSSQVWDIATGNSWVVMSEGDGFWNCQRWDPVGKMFIKEAFKPEEITDVPGVIPNS